MGDYSHLNPGQISIPKEEYIKWSLSILGSILVYLIAALLLNNLYHPDIEAALRMAEELSIAPLGAFKPEPKEKALFGAALIIFPFFLMLFYKLSSWLLKNVENKSQYAVFYLTLCLTTISVLYAGYSGLAATNPLFANPVNAHDGVAKTNLDFYLVSTFLYNHFYLYLFLVFPVVTLFILFAAETEKTISLKNYTRYLNLLAYGWCGLVLCTLIVINTFKFPYTFHNKYDFNVVFYSVVQVFNGIPMLVDNFNSTYGLYPHFIAPIMKLTGLSIFNFSAIMSLLIAFSFLLLLLFLKNNIANKFIVVICFSSSVFYSHFYFRIVTSYDSNFASQPIRLVFPMLSLYFSYIYLNKKNEFTYIFSLFILSLGILWNPEFGASTYLAYLLFIIYSDISDLKNKAILKNSIIHIFSAGFILLATFTFYIFAIKLIYGRYPEISGMFKTFNMFSNVGFNMLEMPLLHPWNIVALIYVLGLCYSLFALINNNSSSRHSMVFLITMLGVASLAYYQGRSHNWNLMPTLLYVFVLLGFFLDSLLKIIPRERILLLHAICIIFIMGSAPFQIVSAAPALYELSHETISKEKSLPEQRALFSNSEFIRLHSRPGERVLILSADQYQSLYHCLSNTASAFDPGFIDMFWRADYDRLLQMLYVAKPKTFVETGFLSRLGQDGEAILDQLYMPTASNGMMTMFEKKL